VSDGAVISAPLKALPKGLCQPDLVVDDKDTRAHGHSPTVSPQ